MLAPKKESAINYDRRGGRDIVTEAGTIKEFGKMSIEETLPKVLGRPSTKRGVDFKVTGDSLMSTVKPLF